MAEHDGSLYLGRIIDQDTSESTPDRLEIASDRLTTHGVIVGMTGSGKTGLGVVLLEEVLSAGVPALILDPKGDMGNLLLNFPELRPDDFEPRVDQGQAKREGVTTTELASQQAALWRKGLEASGVDSERMARLATDVDMRIVTPGSSAGISLDLVGDLSPPDASWDDDAEALRDEIQGLVSGLLVMAGIDADPLTSREHILLSNLIEHGWRSGGALDLTTLLLQVQEPPLRRLGVFDLDTFYPAKDRTKLAMRLNGLMASPSFAGWMEGEPLDMELLLRAPDGRPRASIVYLAHLDDAERMFVVTLLLTKLVTWMRKQPGTSELRALLYADEVAGLAPPTAAPPSKGPLLTLYKQARAHGLGVIMATQNPVDLDYKLMSNAGTWMVGRLQTERDKARVIEGLRSASGDVDIGAWDARIGGLGKREFLLESARASQPTLFTTRWAMSYLRGPLTRADLMRLKPDEGSPEHAAAAVDAAPGTSSRVAAPPEALASDESPVPPAVANGIDVRYADPAATWAQGVGIAPTGRRLEPGLAVRVHMLFDERAGDVRHQETWEAVFFPLDDTFDAEEAIAVDHDPRDFREAAPPDARFALGAAPLDRADFFRAAEKAIEERMFRHRVLRLFRNPALKLYARPGETEEAFRARCEAEAEDRADEEAEKLRDRYESRLDTAKSRLETAERRARELDVDVEQYRQQELLAGAGEVLSMFLGGRRRTRSLSGMSSRRSKTRRTEERLRSAAEKVEDQRDAIEALEDDLAEELGEIWSRWEAKAHEIEPFDVGLEKNDVTMEPPTLFWAPVQR